MMSQSNNKNRNFKGQQETEVVECFCRKHWFSIFRHLIGFVGFLLFIVISGIFFNQIRSFFSQDILIIRLLALAIVGFFTVYIHRLFLRLIRYFLDIVIVTNYRIVILDKSLYLRDSKDAIDLPKIQDIEMAQNGIIRKVLKFGDLVITLSSSSTTKVLHGMPRPDYHFRKINTLKRNYIKTRLKKHDRKTRIEKIIEEVRGEDIPVQTNTITEQTVTGLS